MSTNLTFFYITLYLDAHSGFHVYSILPFDVVFILGVFGSNGNVIKEAESHGLRAFCMMSRGPGISFKNFFRFRKNSIQHAWKNEFVLKVCSFMEIICLILILLLQQYMEYKIHVLSVSKLVHIPHNCNSILAL